MATQTMTETKTISSSSLLPDTSVETSSNEKLSTTVSKPTPYTYDLPYLMITDPNPLPRSNSAHESSSDLNHTLHTIARDAAQSLISTLLTTIPIQSTEDGLIMTIPSSSSTAFPSTNTNQIKLPRFKPLPKPRAPTKWETFAKKKGIGKFNTSGASSRYSENRKNLVYDEEKGEWVRKWGYKGKNKDGETDWLVEVDDKKKSSEADGKNVRSENRRERMEKVRRQERRQRRNDERSRRTEKSR